MDIEQRPAHIILAIAKWFLVPILLAALGFFYIGPKLVEDPLVPSEMPPTKYTPDPQPINLEKKKKPEPSNTKKQKFQAPLVDIKVKKVDTDKKARRKRRMSYHLTTPLGMPKPNPNPKAKKKKSVHKNRKGSKKVFAQPKSAMEELDDLFEDFGGEDEVAQAPEVEESELSEIIPEVNEEEEV